MEEKSAGSQTTIPHFNITTRGAAVDSLKRNPQFQGKEVGRILGAVEASLTDWNQPLNAMESNLVLLGILAGAHSLKTPVQITLDRNWWAAMKDPKWEAENPYRVKEVFCLDPQAVTIQHEPVPEGDTA